MTNSIINEVRSLAYSHIVGLEPVSENPLESLRALDWNVAVSDEPIDQAALLEENILLSPTFCLGRAAKAAAFVEKWFPNSTLQHGEVLEDHLRNLMLDMLSDPPRESELRELLSYEDPHAVIIIDGIQFDPISVTLGIPILHPRIGMHSVWEGFVSDWLVEKAKLESNREEQLNLLAQAVEICPGTAYVYEASANLNMQWGEMTESMLELDKVLEMRPTARSLFVSGLMGNKASKAKFLEIYPAELLQLLQNELEANYEQHRRR